MFGLNQQVRPKGGPKLLKAITSQDLLQEFFQTLQHDMGQHRAVIRTGLTCKKFYCYIPDSACRLLIVKNAKIICSYVKHF